jgi:hypothetical protein
MYFANSLPVTDKRLIGRTFWGNYNFCFLSRCWKALKLHLHLRIYHRITQSACRSEAKTCKTNSPNTGIKTHLAKLGSGQTIVQATDLSLWLRIIWIRQDLLYTVKPGEVYGEYITLSVYNKLKDVNLNKRRHYEVLTNWQWRDPSSRKGTTLQDHEASTCPPT